VESQLAERELVGDGADRLPSKGVRHGTAGHLEELTPTKGRAGVIEDVKEFRPWDRQPSHSIGLLNTPTIDRTAYSAACQTRRYLVIDMQLQAIRLALPKPYG